MHGADIEEPAFEFNIHEHLEVLKRRKWMILTMVVLAAGVGAALGLMSKPVYRTSGSVMAPVGNAANLNILDAGNPLGAVLASGQPESFNSQVELLRSGPFQKDSLKRAGILEQPPAIEIEGAEETHTIRVTAQGGNPRDCARIANTMMQIHQERTRNQQTNALLRTMRFLHRQIATTERRLKNADQRMLEFRKVQRLDDAISERQAQAREVLTMRSRARELESTLSALTAERDGLTQTLEKEPREIEQMLQVENPQAIALRSQIIELRKQKVDVLTDYREASPEVARINDQLGQAEAELNQTAVRIEQARLVPNPKRPPLEARAAELRTSIAGQEKEYRIVMARILEESRVARSDGAVELAWMRLSLERDSVQGEWKTLSSRLHDLQLRAQIPPLEAQILEEAPIPRTPLSNQNRGRIVLCAMVGLMLGLGLAGLLEYMDDRVQSPAQLERVAHLPSLGQIPVLDLGSGPMLSVLTENPRAGEAYRALRAGVGFAALDHPIRRLLITSAHQGEGKTLTATNLAAAVALDGKRVILVDADLRRPGLHVVLGLPQEPGLSQLLAGQTSLDAALLSTSIPTLRVVTAGVIPPNPAELLGSTAFEDVLAELEDQSDLVIIDSPPCLPVTDPIIASSRADGVLLVVSAGKTRKGALRHVLQQFQRARGRVIGVALNRVRSESRSELAYAEYYGPRQAERLALDGTGQGRSRFMRR